jgi:dynein heavy chain 2, cytosolic
MTILKTIISRLTKIKPFEDDFFAVKEPLKHSIHVCQRWIECCHSLTKRIWPASDHHRWEGEEYRPNSIINYLKRIEEVTF